MSTIPVPVARITFDDEFNSFTNSPDGSTGNWMTRYPYSGEAARTLTANHEAEYYSDGSVGENPFSLAGGVLSLQATPAVAGSNPYGLAYDSGLITTDKSFSQLYGYFEVSAKLPSGQGFWPAFWLLPASNNYTSELDVFESIDAKSTTIYSTVHGTTNGKWASDLQAFTVPDTSTGFHTYGVDWEASTTRFYVDGVETGSAPTPASMDDPMFMLLDLAVGGTGSWPGAPDSTTVFPGVMQIDDVRAYATAGTQYVAGRAAIAAAPVTIGSGRDTLALAVSETAWNGDAQFTVAVDGVQIGGIQTAAPATTIDPDRIFDVLGNFTGGPHTLSLDFLNDAHGGSAAADRNLYVGSGSIDGVAVPDSRMSLLDNGSQSFSFNEVSTANPAAAGDTLGLQVSEDAWQGDADYTISVDGMQIGGIRTAAASHAAGASQDVSLAGNWGPGSHRIGIAFINDAYGGSSTADRNLYVDSLSYDGQAVTPGSAALKSNGTANFTSIAGTRLTLLLAGDAWQGDPMFSVAVDGRAVLQNAVVTASNAAGQTQTVDLFVAALTPGPHDLAVSFLNDAYGGSVSADRNLYLKGVEVNGAFAKGTVANLYGNGTDHFSILLPQG